MRINAVLFTPESASLWAWVDRKNVSSFSYPPIPKKKRGLISERKKRNEGLQLLIAVHFQTEMYLSDLFKPLHPQLYN